MRLLIRGYEIPIPVVTILIVVVNTLIFLWSSYLESIPLAVDVKTELEAMERNWKRDVDAIEDATSAELADEDGRVRNRKEYERLCAKRIEELQDEYRMKMRSLAGKIPYLAFIDRWGAALENFSTGWSDIRARNESGVGKILWFGVTLLTCQYVHGGFSHFAWNMIFLLLFGLTVEIEIRSRWFLLFYHLSGIASGMTQFFFIPDPSSLLIGASGAIAGVMGAYLIVAPMAKISLAWIFGALGFLVGRVSATAFFVIWLLIQYEQGLTEFYGGQTGGVAWFAHIGGFAVGSAWLIARDAVKHFGRS